MAQITRTAAKVYLETDKTPSELQYVDILDSIWFKLDDGIPLTISDVGGLLRKVVNIGDWDMDTVQQLSVAHGLDGTKIRGVSAFIIRDDQLVSYPLGYPYQPATDNVPSGWCTWGALDVGLFHDLAGSSFFDDATFSTTPLNRGFIIIDYVS